MKITKIKIRPAANHTPIPTPVLFLHVIFFPGLEGGFFIALL
jgi:hypothetical protein